jgi:hypothetical protein
LSDSWIKKRRRRNRISWCNWGIGWELGLLLMMRRGRTCMMRRVVSEIMRDSPTTIIITSSRDDRIIMPTGIGFATPEQPQTRIIWILIDIPLGNLWIILCRPLRQIECSGMDQSMAIETRLRERWGM